MTARLLQHDFGGNRIGTAKRLLADTLAHHHFAHSVEGVLEADGLIRERMTRATPCRGCGVLITLDPTDSGKSTPTNISGSPHWATCPDADKFRKNRKG